MTSTKNHMRKYFDQILRSVTRHLPMVSSKLASNKFCSRSCSDTDKEVSYVS